MNENEQVVIQNVTIVGAHDGWLIIPAGVRVVIRDCSFVKEQPDA